MALPSLQEEFLQAYDAYADQIFRHCVLRVGDRELGKELMQEAFLKVWEYMSAGNQVQNIRAFLYKTAGNLIIDHVRRATKRREDSLEDMQEEGIDFASPEDLLQQTDTALSGSSAISALQKVDEPYRSAVIMRYVDDLQPQEIADLLDVSANTVSVRIHRGLEKLRSLLPTNG